VNNNRLRKKKTFLNSKTVLEFQTNFTAWRLAEIKQTPDIGALSHLPLSLLDGMDGSWTVKDNKVLHNGRVCGEGRHPETLKDFGPILQSP
jgi:hypothetical protein